MSSLIPIRIFVALVLFSSFNVVQARISSQEEFDRMIEKILLGACVNEHIAPGTYKLKKDIIATGPIRLKGKNVIIYGNNEIISQDDAVGEEGGYNIYRITTDIPDFSMFLDEQENIIPVSESVESETRVNFCSAIDGYFARKPGIPLCMTLSNPMPDISITENSRSYGYFDCGWSVVNFSVKRKNNQFLYVVTHNPTNTKDFNYEKNFYGNEIRYVLFNAEKKEGYIYYDSHYLYVPKKYKKVCIVRNTHKQVPSIHVKSDVDMSGITFINFNGIKVESSTSSACEVKNCQFINTLGSALTIKKKNDSTSIPATIENCRFQHCSIYSGNVISATTDHSDNSCIYIKDCIINRYDDTFIMYKNAGGCVYLNGDVEISDCRIYNTPRCHLYLAKGHIIAHDNILYNEQQFNQYKHRNLSSDFGIIYCDHFTNDPKIAIENTSNTIKIGRNILYDAYAYGNDARGIMIDDGRGDVSCIQNIIHNTGIYSIDSRGCEKYVGTSSIRNMYSGNIVDTKYRIQGGKDICEDDLPIVDGNYILGNNACKITNTKTLQPDTLISNGFIQEVTNDKIIISQNIKRLIKKSFPKTPIKTNP